MLHGMEEHVQLSKISNLTLSEHFVFFPFSFALRERQQKKLSKLDYFVRTIVEIKVRERTRFLWTDEKAFSNLKPIFPISPHFRVRPIPAILHSNFGLA